MKKIIAVFIAGLIMSLGICSVSAEAIRLSTNPLDLQIRVATKEIISANGEIPKNFTREQMNLFIENNSNELVSKVLNNIYQNAVPLESVDVSEQMIAGERTRGSTTYDFDTKISRQLIDSTYFETQNTDDIMITEGNKSPSSSVSYYNTEVNASSVRSTNTELLGWPYEWIEAAPWTYYDTRSTAKIIIKVKDSTAKYRGSGTFIDEDVLITACHVIYSQEKYGGWCDYLVIIPACYEDYYPYGCTTSTFVEIGNYYDTGNNGDDWGIARVENPFPQIDALGYISYGNNNHINKSVRAQGFPLYLPTSSEQNENLYLSSGTVVTDYSSYMKACNATAYGGMSGGPILYTENGTHYIGGIMSAINNSSQNVLYCAFDAWLMSKLNSYKD